PARELSGAPRSSLLAGGGRRLQGLQAPGRLLHPHRRRPLASRVPLRGRSRVCPVPREGDRRRHRAGLVVLLHETAWAHQDPLLLPQTRRHADRGGTAAAKARPLTLRESARTIFDAALAAGDVRPLTSRALREIREPPRGRVLVVGAGKASGAMAAAAEEAWGDRIAAGVVAVKDGYTAPTRRVRLLEAGHPVPDERGAAPAREIPAPAQAPRP